MKENERKDQMSDRETPVSLTEALSALEGMLSNPEHVNSSSDASNQAPTSAPLSQDGEPPGDQATIPVLSKVILSNERPSFAASSDATEDRETLPTSPIYEKKEFSNAVDRLMDELRAIVQTGIEQSNQIATERIMAQVKEHIETMLPEILDDILGPESRRNP